MIKLIASLIFLAFLLPSAALALAGDPPPGLSARPRWQQLAPPTSPPPRSEVAMAYDPVRKVGVLFGGYDGDSRDNTWEFDSLSITWIERFPAYRPSARFGAAMVYDAARGQIVMFGGVTILAEEYSDTWVWDGTDWTQILPASSPSARWLHGMIYDSQRQVVVLFGGLKDATDSGETWEWDGSNWTEQPLVEPPERHGMALAYDARRGVTVMFGGDDTFGPSYFDDTWDRAGGGYWQPVFPATRPEARQSIASAYFPRLRRVIMYGGFNFAGTRLDDTWGWNGQNWLELPLDPHPTGGGSEMVYDPVARGLLLYISVSPTGQLVSETWLFR